MISEELKEKVTHSLISKTGKNIAISEIYSVSGGCINNTCKLVTNHGDFFLKWGHNTPDSMFRAEKEGLDLIRKTDSIYVPSIINSDKDFLLMEFIEESNQTNLSWERFGRDLSELHKNSDTFFGLDHDNFIGSLHQKNTQHSKWTDFFIHQRIGQQLKLSDFSSDILKSFDKLFIKIENLFSNDPPSLIHGDLWSGNFLMLNNRAALIDPAVYFGHREMDIAMSKLFGGFNARFYDSYNENHPLTDGWQERVDICNLYPLLVHVNLFGGSYYSQVTNIINRFI